MRGDYPILSYNPDLGKRQISENGSNIRGGFPKAYNIIPKDNSYRPINKPILYTDTSVDDDYIFIKGYSSAQGANKTIALTTDAIYRIDSATPSEIEHDIDGSKPYTTSDDDIWDIDIYGSTLFLTNYEYPPQVIYTFDTATESSDISEAPDKVKSLQMFQSSLFTFNEVTSSVSYPLRLRRSAQGDPVDFTLSSSTGAGYQDLPSYGEYGVAIRRLGDILVAFCSNSIYFVRYIGPPFWYSYEKIAEKIGALSLHSIAIINKYRIIFIANDRSGLYSVTPNGVDKIESFVDRSHISTIYTNPARITNAINTTNDSVLFTLPITAKEPNQILALNYKEGKYSLMSSDYDTTYQSDLITCIGNILSPDVVIDNVDNYFDTYDEIPNNLTYDSSFWKGGIDAVAITTTNSSNSDISYFDAGESMKTYIESSEIEFDNVVAMKEAFINFSNPQATINVKIVIYSKNNPYDDYTSIEVLPNQWDRFKFLKTGKYFRFVIIMNMSYDAIESIVYNYENKGLI